MSVWRNDEGRVRSGWVVLVFVALAIAAGLLGSLGVGAVLFLLARGDLGRLEQLAQTGASSDSWSLIISSAPMVFATVAATVVCWLLFKEQVGLGRERAGTWLARGLGLGLAALTLAVLAPTLLGVQTLSLSHLPALSVLGAVGTHLVVLAPQSAAEELLLRGIPLRALARGTHPVLAGVLTSSVFGVLHLGNPNASWVAALNVALVGGWFAALTLRTGTLWCSIGLHVSWNFCQGVVYGQPVSGLSPGRSLFAATWPHASGFWSGGDFGPEASGWTSVLLVIGTVVTVLWPKRGAHDPGGPQAPLSSGQARAAA